MLPVLSANWSDRPQKANVKLSKNLLLRGKKPSKEILLAPEFFNIFHLIDQYPPQKADCN